MEYTGVLVEDRVDKAYSGFASLEPLVVDAGKDGRERWSGSTCAADESWEAFVENHDVVADS